MATAKKSSQTGKEAVRRTVDGLKYPYPQKPGAGKFVIYCDTKKQEEDYPRVLILIFAEAYAAARLVHILVGKDEFEECAIGTRTGIVTTSGIRITAFPEQQILDLWAFKGSTAEQEWRDEQMEQSALRFKLGSQWDMPKPQTITEEVEDEATGELVTREVKVKKGKKERKEKAEKKPKLDKTGMVTAGDLATRLGIEARIFRGALRSLKKIKPEGGWLWSKDDAEEIFKEVIKELGIKGKKR